MFWYLHPFKTCKSVPISLKHIRLGAKHIRLGAHQVPHSLYPNHRVESESKTYLYHGTTQTFARDLVGFFQITDQVGGRKRESIYGTEAQPLDRWRRRGVCLSWQTSPPRRGRSCQPRRGRSCFQVCAVLATSCKPSCWWQGRPWWCRKRQRGRRQQRVGWRCCRTRRVRKAQDAGAAGMPFVGLCVQWCTGPDCSLMSVCFALQDNASSSDSESGPAVRRKRGCCPRAGGGAQLPCARARACASAPAHNTSIACRAYAM
jgi:hypothetical protein